MLSARTEVALRGLGYETQSGHTPSAAWRAYCLEPGLYEIWGRRAVARVRASPSCKAAFRPKWPA